METLEIPALAKLDILNFKSRSKGLHDFNINDFKALNLQGCNFLNCRDAVKEWYSQLPPGAPYVFALLATLWMKGYGEYYLSISDLKRWLQRHTVCVNLEQHRSSGVVKVFPINVRPCSKQVCHFDSKRYFNRTELASAKIETLLKLMLEA